MDRTERYVSCSPRLTSGIDLIADLAPTLLDDFNVQILTVGPVIDLYGKFAAEKLALLMQKYPGRLISKPVFTACPPALFMGADFALIPSRDEPFGLVAVEFGRKGALGIGCKVGGLGTSRSLQASITNNSAWMVVYHEQRKSFSPPITVRSSMSGSNWQYRANSCATACSRS